MRTSALNSRQQRRSSSGAGMTAAAAPLLSRGRPAAAAVLPRRRNVVVTARQTAVPPPPAAAQEKRGHAAAGIPMRPLEPGASAASASPGGTAWTAGGSSGGFGGSNGVSSSSYGLSSSSTISGSGNGSLTHANGNGSSSSSSSFSSAATTGATPAAATGTVLEGGSGGPGDLLIDTDFKWARDSYSKAQRSLDTWAFFLTFRARLALLDQKWTYLGGFTEARRDARARALARYLVKSILELGPTFIKVGQLSSTRSDLFPAAFVDELATLQDRVPAFSPDKAVEIIERDLGRPVEELFLEFERRPIAAASLGQVHRAVLKSGERVVVKVQRPGLKALFDIDLENLRLLAEQLDRGEEGRDFVGIYRECAAVLYDEIDYINEGRNCDRFRRNFRGVEWVRAPTVHWELCSPRVLTLEYLPGVKVSDRAALEAAGVDPGLVARRATESYLLQILRHGLFHADPHPGNVSVDPATGALLYYDFGMMGTIPGDVRANLLEVFYGVYQKDTGRVVDALTALGVIRATGDRLSVRRAIGYFIDNLTRQLEREETLGAIGEDLFAIALDAPFRFPAAFTFVLRAFSTLEGIGKSLVPDYRFSEVAAPYAAELLQLRDAGARRDFALAALQQQAAELGQAAAAVPARVASISDAIDQLTAGELKLRVRVLEGERAARRAGVMQAATLQAVAGVGLLDAGVQLALAGRSGPADAVLAAAGVMGVLVLLSLRRVRRLDKFERDLKRGA